MKLTAVVLQPIKYNNSIYRHGLYFNLVERLEITFLLTTTGTTSFFFALNLHNIFRNKCVCLFENVVHHLLFHIEHKTSVEKCLA